MKGNETQAHNPLFSDCSQRKENWKQVVDTPVAFWSIPIPFLGNDYVCRH
jgi:hypothetical protein